MFQRSQTDLRRVIIVDISHLFYKYAFGGAANLTHTIKVDGVPTTVNTTLPTYTIKQIHRWAKGGINPTVVCFDGAGATRSRKGYFINNRDSDGSSVSYKEGREIQSKDFYEGMNITFNLLLQGGVCCLKADGYEADDLIKATVDKAKIDYPNLPIDIITGDSDLVPLVDDQVSVFLVSKKLTWAETKDIEKAHYVQLTPTNYQSYMESLTEYNKLKVPYNTVLLKKLLRGDKSDNIPAYPKFTPTKYNNLVDKMLDDGVDLSELFRYDNPTETLCYRGTEEPIPEDLISSTPKDRMMIKFGNPPTLNKIVETMSNYLDEDIINHMKFVYNGINLNCAYTGMGDLLNRRPAKLSVSIKGYSAEELQTSVSYVKIRLPLL